MASYSQNSDANNHWQECVCGNQKDIDIINNVFNDRNVLDSLHNLNEQIIYNLESEINIQDSIILTQAQTIANNNLALLELEEHNKKIIDSYSDEI